MPYHVAQLEFQYNLDTFRCTARMQRGHESLCEVFGALAALQVLKIRMTGS